MRGSAALPPGSSCSALKRGDLPQLEAALLFTRTLETSTAAALGAGVAERVAAPTPLCCPCVRRVLELTYPLVAVAQVGTHCLTAGVSMLDAPLWPG